MDEVLVSIYIVNHNYGHFLQSAIDSLKSYAERKEYELLIFDNDSSDNSREIIDENRDFFNQVFFQKNIGLTATCNRALREAKGKYIIRLDADDFFLEDGVDKLLKLAQEGRYDVSFGNYYIVDFEEEILRKVQREGVKDNRVLHRPSHGACTLINRRFMLDKGGYYGAFDRQDGYDLWLKAIYFGRVGFTDEYIFNYRSHGNNLTSNWDAILLTRRQIKKYFFHESKMKIDGVCYFLDLSNVRLDRSVLALLKERIIQFLSGLRESDTFMIKSDDDSILTFCKNYDVEYVNGDLSVHTQNYKIKVAILETMMDVSFSAIQEAIISTYIFKAGKCISGEEIKKDSIYRYSSNGLQRYQLKLEGDELDREREDMYLHTNYFVVINQHFDLEKITYVQIPKNRY